jgi:hypothetical protein
MANERPESFPESSATKQLIATPSTSQSFWWKALQEISGDGTRNDFPLGILKKHTLSANQRIVISPKVVV